MSEQPQTVKVYELAKELGIDSISLLDRLKDLNIKVKNHMSDLGDDEARLARTSLKKGAENAGKGPAKKAGAAKPRTKKAADSPANGTSNKATSAGKSSAAAPTAPETAPPTEKKSAPVIRRRTKADGVTETVNAPTKAPSTETYAADGEHLAEDGDYAAQGSEEAPAYEQETVETAPSDGHDQEFAPAATAESPTEEATFAPTGSGTASTSPDGPTVAQSAAAAGVPTHEAPAPSASLQKGAAGARPTIVLPQRPVAVRRSILKIVEVSAPPQRPMIKPAPSPITPRGTSPVRPAGAPGDSKDGFRIIKMTKENLDQMVEEEAAKKRGVGREAEIRPEDVRFADYRKKEMVFLPRRKKLPIGKEVRKTQLTQMSAAKRVVQMQETITVGEFAEQLSVKASDVVRKLIAMGQMVSINASIDFDTATLVAAEYKYEVRSVAFNEDEMLQVEDISDTDEQLLPRPPVVTIMGHVDHGKTTLLDAIREADVAGGEAGGITQHIGAYTVEKNGKLISFIDTPGHEAFSVMRARGANVTDIVILVVSADDGVMPQTREAISHAQAAEVPIIVAINKIDKPGALPDKIKQSLAELNLLAEDWGGQTQYVQVSALKKTNIEGLLDAILLQAEVLDLKGNPNALATGTVLEARLEKGRGPVVSLLVNRGTLKLGDPIVAGPFSGKVKAMVDDKGRAVKTVTPGIAAEVLGFEGVPNAGETFNAAANDADAREIAGNRVDKNRAKVAGAQAKMSLDDLFAKIKTGDVKELNVILKADVFGSCEAIRESLVKLQTEKVKIKTILAAPGGITESDVLLASASNAIILGFNVRPETKARQLAEAEHVEIKTYSIIYELLDDVKLSMTGLLDKKKVERFLGRAEVRQIFSVPKIGVIAGSAVVDGKIIRGASVRLLRDSRIVFEGKMSSLRRFKDDAKEVATGFECGIGIENYNDMKPGDIIEAFQIDLIAPSLDS